MIIQKVKTHLQSAVALTLGHSLPESIKLSKKDKVVISKLVTNLNTICKLNIKEVKEMIKIEPEYQ